MVELGEAGLGGDAGRGGVGEILAIGLGSEGQHDLDPPALRLPHLRHQPVRALGQGGDEAEQRGGGGVMDRAVALRGLGGGGDAVEQGFKARAELGPRGVGQVTGAGDAEAEGDAGADGAHGHLVAASMRRRRSSALARSAAVCG